jgi:hypothetical protein
LLKCTHCTTLLLLLLGSCCRFLWLLPCPTGEGRCIMQTCWSLLCNVLTLLLLLLCNIHGRCCCCCWQRIAISKCGRHNRTLLLLCSNSCRFCSTRTATVRLHSISCTQLLLHLWLHSSRRALLLRRRQWAC